VRAGPGPGLGPPVPAVDEVAAAYWIGGPYLFESEANKQAFIDDPHKYEIIRRM
jgi:hypothetical protein